MRGGCRQPSLVKNKAIRQALLKFMVAALPSPCLQHPNKRALEYWWLAPIHNTVTRLQYVGATCHSDKNDTQTPSTAAPASDTAGTQPIDRLHVACVAIKCLRIHFRKWRNTAQRRLSLLCVDPSGKSSGQGETRQGAQRRDVTGTHLHDHTHPH